MDDTGTEDAKGTNGKDSTSDANAGGESGGKETEFKPITSQDDLDAALTARLARQERQLRKSITDEVKAALANEAKATKAKEDNDFKALYEAETKKREDAERERDTERRTALRSRIAAKHQLPDALAARLSGETEDELDADAKDLAKLVKPRQAPDTESGAGVKRESSGASDRPIPKPLKEGERAYTFDGQPKVAFPPR